MKTKFIILAALLAVAVGTQAQYGSEYYHRTNDTVYNKSEIGFYNWWDFDYMLSLRLRTYITQPTQVGGWNTAVTAIPYSTTTPLNIVGIAGCFWYTPYPNSPNPLPEYLYLFDAGVEGPVYMDRSEIHFSDSTPHRCLNVTSNYQGNTGNNDSCCYYDPRENYLDLYECYFDSGISVVDSFYIGWSSNNYSQYHNPVLMNPVCVRLFPYGHTPCSELDTFPASEAFGICFFPYFDYIFCTDNGFDANPGGNYSWSRTNVRQFVLVYPLIQIDTTMPPSFMCDPVHNFQATVLDTGSGCVFFTWDDFYHYTYCEVQYYSIEQGYNHAVTTTVTGNNMLHLCGLDSTYTYYARIRAYCDTSKIETAWTDWVNFTFPHSDPPQGIAQEPSILDRYTHLMPNPAADQVMVTSELGLRHIEVYNARGLLVYSEPAGYSSHTIDLRGWPAGQYMMTIETPQGKTAKHLVVAR